MGVIEAADPEDPLDRMTVDPWPLLVELVKGRDAVPVERIGPV